LAGLGYAVAGSSGGLISLGAGLAMAGALMVAKGASQRRSQPFRLAFALARHLRADEGP